MVHIYAAFHSVLVVSISVLALVFASCDSRVQSNEDAVEVASYKEYVVEVNGQSIYMKQWSFQGLPIIFISGGGEDMGTWKDVIPEVTDGYSVFTVDLRGQGKSSKPAGTSTWKDLAEDISQLVKKQFKEPVILVGHSLGAMTAAAVAAYNPKSVLALVLEDPPGDISAIFPWLRGQIEIRELPYEERVKHFITKGRTEEQARAAATNVEKMDADAMKDLIAGKTAFDIKEILPMIQCEVLFMLGVPEKGSLAQEEYRVEFRKQIPQARISVWPETGHHLHSPDPAKFVKEVKEFLQQIHQ